MFRSQRTLFFTYLSAILFFASACSKQEAVQGYNPDDYFNPIVQLKESSTTVAKKENKDKISKLQSVGLQISSIRTPETIRIQIFPHLGRYSQPQGRESILNQLTISSTKNCLMTDFQSGATLEQGNKILLTTSNIRQAAWVDCETTAQLVRESSLSSIQYRGRFLVLNQKQASGQNILRVVLHLPFEDYLRGVVPSEMPASWGLEALKAQSIAARTYALYQMRNGPAGEDFDFDDTIQYQAFLGVSRENKNSDEAILLTKSLVLTYDQSLIQAFFSADSGGYTESAENVWRVSFPYCPTKPEVYDLSLVQNDWSYSAALDKIEAELRAKNLIKNTTANLTDLKITKKSISGRAIEIEMLFSDGTSKKYFGPDIQMALRLKSNFMTLTKNNNVLNFSGKGFGHGVGMNQWGAKTLAEKHHWDYQRILFFYFK